MFDMIICYKETLKLFRKEKKQKTNPKCQAH